MRNLHLLEELEKAPLALLAQDSATPIFGIPTKRRDEVRRWVEGWIFNKEVVGPRLDSTVWEEGWWLWFMLGNTILSLLGL